MSPSDPNSVDASSADARPVVIVAGPTASGKSALAVDIAEEFGGVVINADSMQVYRGLEVLSAAPNASLQARVPHRLYGVLDPSEPCSAGEWRERAIAEIRSTHEEGKLPIVTGGTGLYLRSLIKGIDRMPPIPSAIRTAIRQRMADEGSLALHAELAQRDPDSAAMLDAGDRQRITRALELLETTGKGLQAWQTGGKTGDETGGEIGRDEGLRYFSVLLLPPRETLYRAVEARFADMVESGALGEVERLAACNLAPALPAMKALGVPDLLSHVRGDIDRKTACNAAAQATRRYVKRQFTWFRHQIVADALIETQYSEISKDMIFPKISKFLLTCHP